MNATCALLSLALATTLVLATHAPATAQSSVGVNVGYNSPLPDGTYRSDTGAKLVVRSGSIVSLVPNPRSPSRSSRADPGPTIGTGFAITVEETTVGKDGKITLIGKGGATLSLPDGTYRGPSGAKFVVANGKITKTAVDP